ncbi:MAG: hypothetical protein SNJ71_06840, partial [Bacteroidales bacterium]
MELLQKLCSIHSPSGEEGAIKDFILKYIEENSSSWKQNPKIFYDEEFGDSITLIFGTPRTAIFAHTDTVGYTVAYNNSLVKIGSPQAPHNTKLRGYINTNLVECLLQVDESEDGVKLSYSCEHEFKRG